jgi:hypothetical protein
MGEITHLITRRASFYEAGNEACAEETVHPVPLWVQGSPESRMVQGISQLFQSLNLFSLAIKKPSISSLWGKVLRYPSLMKG